MIRHVWTVACTRAVIDQESNIISLIEVVEQINIPEKPAPNKSVALTVDLASFWVRGDPDVPEKGRARITFISPGGAEFGSIAMDIDLSAHERLRSKGRFVNLPAPVGGRYEFRVEFAPIDTDNWTNVASIPLQISFVEDKIVE